MQKLILRLVVHFRSGQLCSRDYWLLPGSTLSFWVSPSVTGSPTSTRRPTCWFTSRLSPMGRYSLSSSSASRRSCGNPSSLGRSGVGRRARRPPEFRPVPERLVGFRAHQRSGLRLDGSMVLWGLDSHQHRRGCVLEARCCADSRYRRRTDTGAPPRQILYRVGCPPCRLIVSLNSFGYTAPEAGLCEVLGD